MEHAIADFFGATLVPELGSNIAAGATCNVELFLVAVAANADIPHELAIAFNNLDFAIKAAHQAVIARYSARHT